MKRVAGIFQAGMVQPRQFPSWHRLTHLISDVCTAQHRGVPMMSNLRCTCRERHNLKGGKQCRSAARIRVMVTVRVGGMVMKTTQEASGHHLPLLHTLPS